MKVNERYCTVCWLDLNVDTSIGFFSLANVER